MSEEQEQNKEETKTDSTVTLDDLKTAYIVGITEEDNFVFQLFGTEKGVVPLLGIHKHATHCVDNIYNHKQMSGDRLTHEIGKAVADIAKKLDDLTSKKTEHLLALKDEKETLSDPIVSNKSKKVSTKTAP
tara:strand:- start:54 stop:446 length:393 start_codon:yes stop_codon:yes gene_type:complete